MSYTTLLESENIQSQYLVVMKPRREMDDSGWTNVSGNIYRQAFDYGHVISALFNGTALTEAATTSVGANEWHYDYENEMLYINAGTNPTGDQVVVTYELYFSSFDAHWHRDPLDTDSRPVYYEPLIVNTPAVTSSASETFLGYLPSYSASIAFTNATKYFQRHIYDSSFNRADISIYHYLDELTVDNVKLVLKGYTENIDADDQRINFSVIDGISFFEKEYRNPSGANFFGSSTWPDLDPQFEGRPIRKIYGRVDGFVPVNIDYLSEEPTTSDNRWWIMGEGYQDLGSVTGTVVGALSSAGTTYLNSVNGFNIGDGVYNLDTGEAVIVREVDTGGNVIQHSNWTTPSAGHRIIRAAACRVRIKQGEKHETAIFGRDYDMFMDATNKVFGIKFNTSMESNIGLPDPLNPSDTVYARVYGQKNTVTKGGVAFGSNSTRYGNLTQAVVILFDLLKGAGLAESEIDLTTFTTLQGSVTDQIGMAIPKDSSADFPPYKDLILQICQTILGKFYLDFDQLWTLSIAGPIASTAKTIEDDEILDGSFSYRIDYKDIVSDVILGYEWREVGDDAQSLNGPGRKQAADTSSVAKHLHGVSKQQTFESLHLHDGGNGDLLERLQYYFGDRQGTIRFRTKNRFFDTELGDNIKISRTRILGFDFDVDTVRERNAAVLSTEKSLNNITIELSDQKGIEDNEGDW